MGRGLKFHTEQALAKSVPSRKRADIPGGIA